MQVNIINKSGFHLPSYATEGSAGVDLMANIDSVLTLKPGNRALIPTGLYISLPKGYEAQVRPRSGLALKYGITVLNTPGTIDSDYTGEIGVILINLGSEPFIIHRGDKVAQMVINKFESAEFIQVEELEKTERGEGGFGHTGI